MIHSLLLAAQSNIVPVSLSNWQTMTIITASCIVMLLIASRTVDRPHDGPKMPLPLSSVLFNDISVPAFLGAMSFGHVVGVGLAFGLSGLLS